MLMMKSLAQEVAQHGIRVNGVAPRQRVRRRYRNGALVLETDFETAEGVATIVDFMPPRGGASELVRLVIGRRGQVQMRMELVIRFDYGSVVPWVARLKDGTGLRAVAGPDMVVLRTSAAVQGQNLTSIAEFAVAAGETVPFVLSYAGSELAVPVPIDPQQALVQTEDFWRSWGMQCRYHGRWRTRWSDPHMVLRALTYARSGGIVAAPTTSLPERIGGECNWDYRYCWLPGYKRSWPVRIGNAPHGQRQLDVYGESWTHSTTLGVMVLARAISWLGLAARIGGACGKQLE
jgi:GH15 family glucan-1,4-alpha-glucosidase